MSTRALTDFISQGGMIGAVAKSAFGTYAISVLSPSKKAKSSDKNNMGKSAVFCAVASRFSSNLLIVAIRLEDKGALLPLLSPVAFCNALGTANSSSVVGNIPLEFEKEAKSASMNMLVTAYSRQ